LGRVVDVVDIKMDVCAFEIEGTSLARRVVTKEAASTTPQRGIIR